MHFRLTDESLTWRRLCRAAALEQDPDKLSQIVRRMNAALRAQQRKLRSFGHGRRNLAHMVSHLNPAA